MAESKESWIIDYVFEVSSIITPIERFTAAFFVLKKRSSTVSELERLLMESVIKASAPSVIPFVSEVIQYQEGAKSPELLN